MLNFPLCISGLSFQHSVVAVRFFQILYVCFTSDCVYFECKDETGKLTSSVLVLWILTNLVYQLFLLIETFLSCFLLDCLVIVCHSLKSRIHLLNYMCSLIVNMDKSLFRKA